MIDKERAEALLQAEERWRVERMCKLITGLSPEELQALEARDPEAARLLIASITPERMKAAAALGVSLEELRELDKWLHDRIRNLEEPEEIPVRPGREVVKERKTPRGTLRLELVCCGKKGCHCGQGQGHGPYWYRYWREGGRMRSKYVGKEI